MQGRKEGWEGGREGGREGEGRRNKLKQKKRRCTHTRATAQQKQADINSGREERRKGGRKGGREHVAGVRVPFYLYLSSMACGACVCVTREREEEEDVSNERKKRKRPESEIEQLLRECKTLFLMHALLPIFFLPIIFLGRVCV